MIAGRRSWIRSAWTMLGVTALIGVLVPGANAAGPVVLAPSTDPFYAYAGDLTAAAPGTVLRSRDASISVAQIVTPFKATQVLYRTTNALGAPTLAVATVLRPLVLLQQNRLIGWQEAYDDLGDSYAPSYTIQGGGAGDQETALMAPLLAAGYPIVDADYETEQNVFPIGVTEGHATLDAIRAAESVLGFQPHDTRVALEGYSGGAIASEWASELAPTYAPELDLVGTAMGGVAVDLAHNLDYVNGSQTWSGAIPAALIGMHRAYGFDLSKYLSAIGRSVIAKVDNTNLRVDLGAFPGLRYQQLLAQPYSSVTQIKPLVDGLNASIMGRGTPREPLLIQAGNVDGTGDGVMVLADQEALARTYCARGVSVDFTVYQGSDHFQAADYYMPSAISFLLARLAGLPAQNGCAQIPAGNSLAPLTYRPVTATAQVSTRAAISGAHPYSMRMRRYYPVRVYVRTTGAPGGYVYLTVTGAPGVPKTYKVEASNQAGSMVAIALTGQPGTLHVVARYAGSPGFAAAPAYNFDPAITK